MQNRTPRKTSQSKLADLTLKLVIKNIVITAQQLQIKTLKDKLTECEAK